MPQPAVDPSYDANKRRVEELLWRFGEVLTVVRGGYDLSTKLHNTAVNLLTNKASALQGRLEKDAAAARLALSQDNLRAAEFEQRCDELKAAGVPRVDDFLIVLHNILKSPEVHKALCSTEAPPRPPSRGIPVPSTASSVTGAPSRLSRGPTVPGTIPASRETSERSSAANNRMKPLLVDDETLSPAPNLAPHSSMLTPNLATPASHAIDFDNSENSPAAAPTPNGSNTQPRSRSWLSNHNNPIYGQLGLNSPFVKSGADYWREESAEPSDANGDSPSKKASLPPVGDLFDFKAAKAAAKAGTSASEDDALPAMPEWLQERPYLTGEHLMQSAEAPRVDVEDAQPLSSYPRAVQEHILMDDLLFAFMGLDGRYAHAKRVDQADGAHITFVLEARADPSLQELATRMLPICDSVVIMERWAEVAMGYSHGRVCHAVAGAMKGLIQDWNLMIVQLEHQMLTGHLTLQGMWYYVQPPLASLSLAASVASEAAARKLRGASLLNLLHARYAAVAGDTAARGLLSKLLQAGAAPYFKMLERWLCEGVLDDPYSEFMVEENTEIKRDSINAKGQSAFWHNRYTLRQAAQSGAAARAPPREASSGYPGISKLGEGTQSATLDVPTFLDSLKDTILTTGKHWNAIKECNCPVVRPLPANVHIEYSTDGSYTQHIHTAVTAASKALLDLVIQKAGLREALAALKSYFLLARGDLFTVFVDIADTELAKTASDVILTRLQSLLELAVRSTSAGEDPYAETLTVSLDSRSLLTQLQAVLSANANGGAAGPRQAIARSQQHADKKAMQQRSGRECFTMSMKLEWPVSIVVSQASLNMYQALLRHLFELELCERSLQNIWRVCQSTRPLFKRPEKTLMSAYGLCQQMMHVFHQFHLYVTFEVMEPAWIGMQSSLDKAHTLDEALAAHEEFMKRVMKGTLLSRKVKTLKALNELKEVVNRFAKTGARLQKDLDQVISPTNDPITGEALQDRQRRVLHMAALAKAAETHVGNDNFQKDVIEVQELFQQKFQNFHEGLEDIHKGALGVHGETREELDGLLNLIARLDYNNFLSGEVDYQALFKNTLVSNFGK
ncbi:Gamma-tubulin complex component 2 [Coccomyxa sp. Obi]|nr:Gamma-tubulin complex component 2 [Coccomyxa sp. Obi]